MNWIDKNNAGTEQMLFSSNTLFILFILSTFP